jgi:hypothetical protein
LFRYYFIVTWKCTTRGKLKKGAQLRLPNLLFRWKIKIQSLFASEIEETTEGTQKEGANTGSRYVHCEEVGI